MPYWGIKPADSDYAATSLGANVYLLKERMFKDATTVLGKSHPEQSIIVSLQCLRLLAGQFPTEVSLHFGKKDFQESKAMFAKWYEAVKGKLPAKYREGILLEAEKEFALFEKDVLNA